MRVKRGQARRRAVAVHSIELGDFSMTSDDSSALTEVLALYSPSMRQAKFTEADLDYLSANYLTLEALCADRSESAAEVEALIDHGRLPRPSYVLEDGTGMFPPDYFRLVDEAGGVDKLNEQFAARHRAASLAHHADPDELRRDWDAYLNGIYGICLREVTPEAIVRKTVLVSSLCELLMLPRPRNPEWQRELREQTEELDALEREFAPDYDRSDDEDRPPTRDLLINTARERYPDVFADSPGLVTGALA
jgi:hypothetical protein